MENFFINSVTRLSRIVTRYIHLLKSLVLGLHDSRWSELYGWVKVVKTQNVPDSFPELTKASAVSWEGGVSGGYQVLLLDEDRGWLLVGGKDHIYLLSPDHLDHPTQKVRG